MAHAIDQTTGRAAVFVVGEPAWHRLGVVIENATTSAEAIGLAGLDWRVEQWPVRAFDPDNHSNRGRHTGHGGECAHRHQSGFGRGGQALSGVSEP
jgi:hypothetical protein